MSDSLLTTPLPSFLPNPSRVLISAFDIWNSSSQHCQHEKAAVLRSLKIVIDEERNSNINNLVSIPVLIKTSDPPSNWCKNTLSRSPPLQQLLQ